MTQEHERPVYDLVTRRWILDDRGNAVQRPYDLVDWAGQHKAGLRPGGSWRVARTEFQGADGSEVVISTVFLAIDHGFGAESPILWETMVFGGLMDQRQWRYAGTQRQAALLGHQAAVAEVMVAERGLAHPGRPDRLDPQGAGPGG